MLWDLPLLLSHCLISQGARRFAFLGLWYLCLKEKGSQRARSQCHKQCRLLFKRRHPGSPGHVTRLRDEDAQPW